MNEKIPTQLKNAPDKAPTKVRSRVRAKGTLLYPDSSEREYASLALKHARMYGDLLKEHLPEIETILRETARTDSKDYHDDAKILDFSERFSRTIRKMEKELAEKLDDFDTERFIKKVAKRANGSNTRQWLQLIKKTYGIDLDGHYYNKGTWADMIDRWAAENVSYVKSIPQDSLATLRQIVQNGYYEGWGLTKIRNEIMKAYGVSKKKAKMLAADQMGSLCAQITRKKQTDAGCKRYRWKARNDNRVRDAHKQYNGKIFSWDNPPPAWYMTKTKGKVFTGRHCHPGEDYCCRCIAIPIFDSDTLQLPVKSGYEEAGQT